MSPSGSSLQHMLCPPHSCELLHLSFLRNYILPFKKFLLKRWLVKEAAVRSTQSVTNRSPGNTGLHLSSTMLFKSASSSLFLLLVLIQDVVLLLSIPPSYYVWSNQSSPVDCLYNLYKKVLLTEGDLSASPLVTPMWPFCLPLFTSCSKRERDLLL